MENSNRLKLREAFLTGLAAAIIAAAVTYWTAVDKSKNEAILKNALAESKEAYLNQIKESIAKIAKAEANSENAALNSQKFIFRLASIEEQANAVLKKLRSILTDSERQSISLDERTLKELQKNLSNDIASIQIPRGAVLPFNSVDCPDGWTEYEKAYGRFIRGIDKTGRGDPDGIRLPGSHQEDLFQRHNHDLHNMQLVPHIGGNPGPGTTWITSNDSITTGNAATGKAGTETRPKNVALLFCQKD